jgi:hypothetical protein
MAIKQEHIERYVTPYLKENAELENKTFSHAAEVLTGGVFATQADNVLVRIAGRVGSSEVYEAGVIDFSDAERGIPNPAKHDPFISGGLRSELTANAFPALQPQTQLRIINLVQRDITADFQARVAQDDSVDKRKLQADLLEETPLRAEALARQILYTRQQWNGAARFERDSMMSDTGYKSSKGAVPYTYLHLPDALQEYIATTALVSNARENMQGQEVSSWNGDAPDWDLSHRAMVGATNKMRVFAGYEKPEQNPYIDAEKRNQEIAERVEVSREQQQLSALREVAERDQTRIDSTSIFSAKGIGARFDASNNNLKQRLSNTTALSWMVEDGEKEGEKKWTRSGTIAAGLGALSGVFLVGLLAVGVNNALRDDSVQQDDGDRLAGVGDGGNVVDQPEIERPGPEIPLVIEHEKRPECNHFALCYGKVLTAEALQQASKAAGDKTAIIAVGNTTVVPRDIPDNVEIYTYFSLGSVHPTNKALFDRAEKAGVVEAQIDVNGDGLSRYVKADSPAWRDALFSAIDKHLMENPNVEGLFLDVVFNGQELGDLTLPKSSGLVKQLREYLDEKFPDRALKLMGNNAIEVGTPIAELAEFFNAGWTIEGRVVDNGTKQPYGDDDAAWVAGRLSELQAVPEDKRPSIIVIENNVVDVEILIERAKQFARAGGTECDVACVQTDYLDPTTVRSVDLDAEIEVEGPEPERPEVKPEVKDPEKPEMKPEVKDPEKPEMKKPEKVEEDPAKYTPEGKTQAENTAFFEKHMLVSSVVASEDVRFAVLSKESATELTKKLQENPAFLPKAEDLEVLDERFWSAFPLVTEEGKESGAWIVSVDSNRLNGAVDQSICIMGNQCKGLTIDRTPGEDKQDRTAGNFVLQTLDGVALFNPSKDIEEKDKDVEFEYGRTVGRKVTAPHHLTVTTLETEHLGHVIEDPAESKEVRNNKPTLLIKKNLNENVTLETAMVADYQIEQFARDSVVAEQMGRIAPLTTSTVELGQRTQNAYLSATNSIELQYPFPAGVGPDLIVSYPDANAPFGIKDGPMVGKPLFLPGDVEGTYSLSTHLAAELNPDSPVFATFIPVAGGDVKYEGRPKAIALGKDLATTTQATELDFLEQNPEEWFAHEGYNINAFDQYFHAVDQEVSTVYWQPNGQKQDGISLSREKPVTDGVQALKQGVNPDTDLYARYLSSAVNDKRHTVDDAVNAGKDYARDPDKNVPREATAPVPALFGQGRGR